MTNFQGSINNLIGTVARANIGKSVIETNKIVKSQYENLQDDIRGTDFSKVTNENTDLVDKIIKDPDLTGKEEKELLQQYKTYHDVGIKTERLKKENEARKAMGLPELSSFPERKYVDPTKRHPIEQRQDEIQKSKEMKKRIKMIYAKNPAINIKKLNEMYNNRK